LSASIGLLRMGRIVPQTTSPIPPWYNKMLGPTYSIAFVPTREDAMATYIMLVNWTDQGIQKIKDSPRRFDMAKQAPGDVG
jgi:hypothetical protein